MTESQIPPDEGSGQSASVTRSAIKAALVRLERAVDLHLGRSAWTQTTHLKNLGYSEQVRKELYAAHDEARATLAATVPADPWQPIATAPKHVEVLAWRDDAGTMLCIHTHLADSGYLTDKEQDETDEETLWQEDWFWFGPRGMSRMEGSEVPTLWMHVPEPSASSTVASGDTTKGDA